MKAFKFFRLAVILSGILLSACAGAPSSPSVTDTGSTGAEDSSSSEVVFTGLIESMDGDQWVINGQTLTVDASALQGGPFMIGDTVKVEAVVTGDGSVTAKIVESPSAVDLAEAQGTPAASPAATSLVFDDSGTEAVGTVEAITDTSITVGGQTFTFAPGVEIKDIITAGMIVKLHFIAYADGTLSVTQAEIADPTLIDNSNANGSMDNNANDNSSNDDNSNADNSNDSSVNDNSSDDDNSNSDDNSNNNSADDNGNDDNSNDQADDNSNEDNSNEDNSNDSNDNG